MGPLLKDGVLLPLELDVVPDEVEPVGAVPVPVPDPTLDTEPLKLDEVLDVEPVPEVELPLP